MVTLVILPGMDGTGTLHDGVVAALGRDFQTTVAAYPSERALGYPELEAIVRALLPQDRPYMLLGESFSGPIAISIAASGPPGLIGIVLACSFARNPRPALAALRPFLGILPLKRAPLGLLSACLLGQFTTAKLRAALKEALATVSAPALRARARAILDIEVTPLLPRIAVPVLYLRGTADRVVPSACSEAILRGVPNARIVDIDGPHFLLQTAPQAAAAAIKNFVTAIST
jgi:pimeloyl-ACP methyl ester carboxylesterase